MSRSSDNEWMQLWRDEHGCSLEQGLPSGWRYIRCPDGHLVAAWNSVEAHLQAAEWLGVPAYNSATYQEKRTNLEDNGIR